MHISNKPAKIYITADVGNGGEGCCDIGGVVHSKEQACDDLGNQAKAQEGAKVPSGGDIGGGREVY